MMRGLALLAGLVLAGPAFADAVLPRLGPLPVLAEDGSVSGAANIPFGERLTILSEDGAVLTVQDGTGQHLRVRATDVIAAPKARLTLMPADQLAGAVTDRPDLQLWDSAFQLRVFLDGAGSGKIVPSMMIPAGSDLAKAKLPVLSIDKAETSVGTPVTMVQALFPLLLSALDPAGQRQGTKIVLHVLVDGSDYARPFMVEKLRLLSRTLAAQPDPFGDEVHFTRQVLFESGAVRDDGEVSASGLRSEWTAAKTTTKKPGLTAALSAAMQAMAEGLNPSDGATHLVLILAGPGLSGDAAALKSATAVGTRLAKRQAEGAEIGGILLAQGTPEPNPANAAVLAELAGGAQTKLADFGTDLMSELAALTAAKAHDPAADLVATICAEAAAGGIPCLVPTNSSWPPETASALAAGQQTTWVALPLWLVSEAAPLDLVPDGSAPADVRGDQPDIRACFALGHVWDAANKACGPAEVAQGNDAFDQLIAAQADISTATSERDAAWDKLAQKQIEWQDEKRGLAGQLSSAEADRDAARAALAQMQDTVATQTAALAEAQTSAAAQADEITQLAAQEQTVKADLLAAQNQAADLSGTLDQRSADLEAASRQIAELGQQEQQITAALNAAQTQLATLDQTAATLAQSLDVERAAKAALEAKAIQAEAELQDRLTKSEARSAELEQTTAALSQSLDDTRAAKAEVETKAAQAEAELQDRLSTTEARSAELEQTTAALSQSLDDTQAAKAEVEARAAKAQADLKDRLTASAAGSADLQAQLAQAQTTIDALTAAKDDVSASLSKAEAARASAEQGLQDKDAKITELAAEIESLKGSVKDGVQQLADLDATLAAERQDSQAMQTKAAAEIDRLNGEVADLTRTGDVNATLLAQSDRAKADLAALRTENDALSKANLAATSKLKALSDATDKADAKLAQVSQDLAAARQKLDAVQSQSTAQIAALQAQVNDLTTSRGDLSGQVAQLGVEKTGQVAARQAEREAFAKQVSALEAQLKTVAQVAVQPAPAPEMSSQAEAPLFAAGAIPRPKPRPAGLLAAATPAATPASPKAKAPAAPATADPVLASRQVAPSLRAAALKGCQFEWKGPAGRLVCP